MSITKSCFIAMPVATTKAHAEIFGDSNHWEHVMESLFVPAVEAAGFEVWRPVATGSHLIHAEIVKQLEQADMVLCDISQANPNVFFELGVRTSVNKPIALVRCDDTVSIPFDVSGVNTHTYEPSLKAWLIDSEIEKLAEHLLAAERTCAGENPIWRQFGMVLKAQEPTSGGTKEEAIFSVLSQQLAELNAGLTANRSPQTHNTGARFNDLSGNEMSHSPSFHELATTIKDIGADYGLQVDVKFHPERGVLVDVQPGSGSSQVLRDGYRAKIMNLVEREDIPVEFRTIVKRSAKED